MQSTGKNIGSLIKKLRIDKELTQEQLAERAGITPNYVGEIERGKKIPSVIVVFDIAKGLDMAASDLVRGVEKAPKGKTDNAQLTRISQAVEGLNSKELDFVINTINALRKLTGK